MTEMGAAVRANDFDALHIMTKVFDFGQRCGDDRAAEAGPAAGGVEFGARIEQGLVAACASVEALFMTVPIATAERSFGAFFACDFILQRRQAIAPLVFATNDGGLFAHGHGSPWIETPEIRCAP